MQKLFKEIEINYLIDFGQYKVIFLNDFKKKFEINQKEITIESVNGKALKKNMRNKKRLFQKKFII